MASIKLGAIITDIAGSIGGTTFRRTPRGIIAYNKQGTQIKSAFAPNSVKAQLGDIFRRWALLTESEKTFWNEQAAIYQFPNKFGALVNLTGRQFFTKLNAQLIPTGTSVEANTFDPVIEPGYFSHVVADWGTDTLTLYFSLNMPSTFVLVSIYPIRKGEESKPHLKTKPLIVQFGIPTAQLEIGYDFTNAFPFAKPFEKYGVNITTMNPSGLVTSVSSFSIAVEVNIG